MTLGNSMKNKSANPQGAKCQKCLERGHWTYECKGKRKIVMRDSRMTILNKRMKMVEQMQNGLVQNVGEEQKHAKQKKKKKEESSSDSSSDSSSSSSSSSDSSSSSSSSSEQSDNEDSDGSSSNSSGDKK
ncbi:zinc finger CCHC domain-containing protein 10-like [Macrosteles quadrilineatus]|uniref:zinc finger CCHC domain-containing protein 10-like n=1 Tax=Macrosteles quadrilineatus TaxID=74068 RepID=UPI0023E13324|nr:zinc finger CCHC domain-containing protein 10-like [Macrosteles quadrilineatus]